MAGSASALLCLSGVRASQDWVSRSRSVGTPSSAQSTRRSACGIRSAIARKTASEPPVTPNHSCTMATDRSASNGTVAARAWS
jgi:hypothetical protein